MTTTDEDAPAATDAAVARRRVDAERRTTFRRLLVSGILGAATILGVGAWIVYGLDETPGMATDGDDLMDIDDGAADMGDMGDMGSTDSDAPQLPAVSGVYDGEEILFIHSETSDPDIAATLTSMMDSPVILVPSLAEVPANALADVYVFTNGIEPDGPRGPLGYQPDVFDSVPGDAGYRPLRSVQLVTWQPNTTPRLLDSAEAIIDAEADGDVTIEEPGVVVNMPIIAWPDGSR